MRVRERGGHKEDMYEDRELDDMPEWGEPPDAVLLGRLLGERYPLEPNERVAAIVDEEGSGIEAVLTRGRSRISIRVDYLRGAGGERDPWMLIADALDELFGMLIESGRAYRELPRGSDVEFQGAYFRVTVQHSIPELDKLADQLLEGKE